MSIEACRYAPLPRPLRYDRTEMVIGGGVVFSEDEIVTFPRNTDVTEKDRLVVTVSETGEIFDFEVVGVKGRTREFSRPVSCRLVR
jgi:hypothetical protein